jgi:hypothetical protein
MVHSIPGAPKSDKTKKCSRWEEFILDSKSWGFMWETLMYGRQFVAVFSWLYGIFCQYKFVFFVARATFLLYKWILTPFHHCLGRPTNSEEPKLDSETEPIPDPEGQKQNQGESQSQNYTRARTRRGARKIRTHNQSEGQNQSESRNQSVDPESEWEPETKRS